jgi:predicted Zn-dependent protease
MPVERRLRPRLLFVGLLAAALPAAGVALAAEVRFTDCRMKYDLKGWSVFYKTAKGSGVITCENGQSMKVKLVAKGGGISFGKSEIVGGTGRFTEVRSIEELLGSYVQSEAHAGAGKSADAQALTKGEVSLSLAGTGRGVDVGFAFGKFTIQRAP